MFYDLMCTNYITFQIFVMVHIPNHDLSLSDRGVGITDHTHHMVTRVEKNSI